MANESREITIRVGVKLTDAEIEAIDPKDRGRLQAQPGKPDVDGQSYTCVCMCPYCGCSGFDVVSGSGYRFYTCHCCGGTFKA